MPPTVFWGRDNDGSWTLTDRLLSQALTVYEDSLCRCGCGGYRDECLNEDLQDEWEPRVGHHWRRAVLDKAREDFETELKEPGAFLYVVDTRKEE